MDFFLSVEILITECWAKPVRPDSGATPDSVFLLPCNFPYRGITITTQFFHLLFWLHTDESNLASESGVGERKDLGSSVRKEQGEAGDLVVGLMPARDHGWLCTSQGSAPSKKERKKKNYRDKKNIYLKNAHKNPAVS